MEKNLLQQGDVFRLDLGNVNEDTKAALSFIGLKADDVDKLSGEYIVERVEEGGTSMGLSLPDGHHVYCIKKDNPNIKVDFFQTGRHPFLIPNIKPLNREIE